MRSSILACAVLAGVSLAQSSTSGAALDNGFQTAHITVYPDACSAQHPGPEFVLPPAITAVSSEEPLSFTTITTTSTHVVWMTEDKKSDETASETSISVPLIAYAPFTPPIAPLSCDDAPTLTYISETVFETLPATTVTTTSVSTTTELVDHDFYSTSYVYVTPSQTPVTVTATATVTASPSLSTVMITDSVIVIHNVTVTASPERVSVTITETESASASRTMGAVLTSGLSKSMGTTLNIVPVDSFSVFSSLSKTAPTSSVLRPTMSADSSSASTPISSGSPVISTLVTSSSPLISSKYVPLTSRTSHPVSGVNSGSAPFPSHLSTGYTTPVTPKTTSMASSLATAPMVSSTPVACLTTRNITLNFDNLPINHRDKESPRLPSPYEHFYFSKGWIYGRSASVTHKQFPASSGNSMAAYLPSLSGNASAPGSFGIIPNDAKVAHGFKMRSLRFGCNGLNAPKDEICRVLITGIPLEQGIRKHAIEVDIEPCMFASGCALAVVNFGQDMFPALRAMQFSASIGNQTVGWFIDDINMGVEVGCDSTHHGTVPVHRGMQHGIVRKRSISYEPFTEPAQDFAK